MLELTPVILRVPAGELGFARRCCHKLLTEYDMAPYSAQMLLVETALKRTFVVVPEVGVRALGQSCCIHPKWGS
jgi:hypothetical protein